MDYTYILNEIYNIICNNEIIFFSLVGIVVLLFMFILSRTFRKSGLFLLANVFIIDNIIKNLPYSVYENFPIVLNIVRFMYILAFINFIIRVIVMIGKVSINGGEAGVKEKSSFRKFMDFTGIGPFVIMLIVNLINYGEFIPTNIINLLTSLSFLYMAFKTLYSTYKYLSKKESLVIDQDMNFDDIKAYLTDEKISKNRNINRHVRKTLNDIDEVKGVGVNTEGNNHISLAEINKSINPKIEKNIERIKKELSDTDMINIIKTDDRTLTTIRLTDLISGKLSSYTSEKASFNLAEDKEYKIDLEFENYNDYDYGRFIDLLIKYSKNREAYKFELIISSESSDDFKIVFFDPSEMFDLSEKGESDIGGRSISMNFPKYKINFIKGNY